MFMPKKSRLAIYSYLFQGASAVRGCLAAAAVGIRRWLAVEGARLGGPLPQLRLRAGSAQLAAQGQRTLRAWHPFLACGLNCSPPCAAPAVSATPARALAEGVITVQKDPRLENHHILSVKNVHVLDALRSLKSRGCVKEVYNWQWFYYFLTDDGIKYLRTYLLIDSEDVVPQTLKKPAGKPSG